VERDGASVTNGNRRKFVEDALNGNDIQDRFLVVKLMNHLRANRFQPSFTEEHAIMSIIAITCIIVIITQTNHNITIDELKDRLYLELSVLGIDIKEDTKNKINNLNQFNYVGTF
jgi:hypothetical protein